MRSRRNRRVEALQPTEVAYDPTLRKTLRLLNFRLSDTRPLAQRCGASENMPARATAARRPRLACSTEGGSNDLGATNATSRDMTVSAKCLLCRSVTAGPARRFEGSSSLALELSARGDAQPFDQPSLTAGLCGAVTFRAVRKLRRHLAVACTPVMIRGMRSGDRTNTRM